MCIIVAKNKGINLPSKDILKNCYDRNGDGIGVAFYLGNRVIIDKGYTDFEKWYKHLMKLDKSYNLKDKSMIFHFRISTSGLVDKGNTHPYPITDKNELLRALYVKTDLAMAHNGIISQFNKKDNVLNDTQLFIKNYVYEIYKLDKEFYKNDNLMKLLHDAANSKLAFITKENTIHLLGDFTLDNGIYYSNSTYKKIEYKYSYSNSYYDNYYNNYYESYYNYFGNTNNLFNYNKPKDTIKDKGNKKEKKQVYLTYGISGYENKTLDTDTFCQIIDNVNFLNKSYKIYIDKDNFITLNQDYCIDANGDIYEINYTCQKFNYINTAIDIVNDDGESIYNDLTTIE